jgi:beta-mannosidase
MSLGLHELNRQPVDSGWQFKQRDPARSIEDDFRSGTGWRPASVPGTVHQDLMAAGLIPDPFVGTNERDVQWVGEAEWLYRCTFELSRPDAERIDLHFDGLDTFARVWLNGRLVLASDNMFIPWRIRAKAFLRPGQNDLWLLFDSAWARGKALEADYGVMTVWNTDASRVYVRKAQYHYGWDWGPMLLTAGVWRPVWLEAYSARLDDLDCRVAVAPDLASARLTIQTTVEGEADTVAVSLFDPSGAVIASAEGAPDGSLTFDVAAPHLWYPKLYGEQPLYRVQAELRRAGQTLHTASKRIGLRRLRLVQEPVEGEPGTSFYFEVNNTPVFCGGANWIPADSFAPRVTSDRYRAWLERAADANMNMLRVWGGGYYEDDAFYDACDELGILVWQDFMFGCGLYPAHAEFQAVVHHEAETIVRRLRHHPCIALWCGNNEDYSIARSAGVWNPTQGGDLANSAFPARAIYERLLPGVCAALDPDRPYWPGSPYNEHFGERDQLDGDMHIWDVWHNMSINYTEYARLSARFVSEFGMQGFPRRETLDSIAPGDELHIQSRVLDFHNKDANGPMRIAAYITRNVPLSTDFDAYVHASQTVQVEALTTAYVNWRRRWMGPGRYALGGALVWQLNDCWPVISWAICDYYLRPKAAYYAVRRALAPIALGLARAERSTAVWAMNGALATRSLSLELRAINLDGGVLARELRRVTLAPNAATELGTFDAQGDVIAARLLDGEAVVARFALWPEPLKYVTLPDPGLTLTRTPHNGGESLRLDVARPAKAVVLDAGPDAELSDNGIDLMPGDPQDVVVLHAADGLIGVRCLGKPAINER